MILTSTLHNHCDICDGRCSAEEMIEAAIAAGFTDFGLPAIAMLPSILTIPSRTNRPI